MDHIREYYQNSIYKNQKLKFKIIAISSFLILYFISLLLFQNHQLTVSIIFILSTLSMLFIALTSKTFEFYQKSPYIVITDEYLIINENKKDILYTFKKTDNFSTIDYSNDQICIKSDKYSDVIINMNMFDQTDIINIKVLLERLSVNYDKLNVERRNFIKSIMNTKKTKDSCQKEIISNE